MATKKTTAKKASKKITPIMKSGIVEEADRKPARIYKARGKYRIVDGASKTMIEPSSPETRTEDEILSPTKRAMLLDLTRNLVRNSSLFNTILGQLSTNVVSTCGGKVVLSLPNEETNKDLRKTFFSYTRNVDFYTGDNLNRMLKRVLREYVIGGDCVLIFDDGLIEDSGKVLLFESNEIVDVPLSAVQEHYGKGAWISQGKVYSPNGRHIGTVVSKSQKNLPCSVVDPSKCYFLKKDPNGNPLDNYWFQFSSNWREGRGVSQAASAISTIHQLEDLVQSELMSARRNSQIFCWLTQDKEEQAFVPSTFDSEDDIEGMTDEEIK